MSGTPSPFTSPPATRTPPANDGIYANNAPTGVPESKNRLTTAESAPSPVMILGAPCPSATEHQPNAATTPAITKETLPTLISRLQEPDVTRSLYQQENDYERRFGNREF